MRRTFQFATMCVLAVFGTLVSCVSVTDELDLDKDLSLDIQLAPNGMTIPLGSLDKIYIDSLIKIEDGSPITLLDNNSYGITMDGTIDPVSVDIEALNISVPSPSITPFSLEFEKPLSIDLIVNTNEISSFLIEPQRSKLSIESEVDPSLVSIRRIGLKERAAMNIVIDFDNLPASCTALELQNLAIRMPEFIKPIYEGNDARISVVGSTVKVSGLLLRSAGEMDSYTIPLFMEGLDFGDPVATVESVFSVEDDIEISGAFKLGGETVNINDLGSTVTVAPRFDISDFTVTEVTGVVSPDIDPISKSVDLNLGSDMDFLTNGNNRLSLRDPKIALSLTSSITMPLNLSVKLSSKDKDGAYIAKDIAPKNGVITIPACPADQQSKHTVFVLTCNSNPKTDSGDTVYVEVTNLPDLMETIPASVDFDIAVTTDGEEQTIDLTRTLSVSGGYDVAVPLSFNDLYIEYTDTIGDLAKDLEDIADKAGAMTLKLKAKVESTLPFGLEITALPYNASMAPSKGITVSAGKLAAGGASPVTSDLTLEIKAAAGALGNLDKLVLKAGCKAENSTLSKGQYLHIKDMSLSIPEGIVLDLTEKDEK